MSRAQGRILASGWPVLNGQLHEQLPDSSHQVGNNVVGGVQGKMLVPHTLLKVKDTLQLRICVRQRLRRQVTKIQRDMRRAARIQPPGSCSLELLDEARWVCTSWTSESAREDSNECVARINKRIDVGLRPSEIRDHVLPSNDTEANTQAREGLRRSVSNAPHPLALSITVAGCGNEDDNLTHDACQSRGCQKAVTMPFAAVHHSQQPGRNASWDVTRGSPMKSWPGTVAERRGTWHPARTLEKHCPYPGASPSRICPQTQEVRAAEHQT